MSKKHSKEQGAQIDLLFDRQDDVITLCEIKYNEKPYVLTKEYVDKLKRKVAVFREQTGTVKQLFLAMITANGIKNNYYADDMIDSVVKADALFED